MLAKLFRQDMKSKGRVLLLIYEILAAATLLVVLVGVFDKYAHSGVSGMIYMVSGSLYFMTILVLVVTTFIYQCVSFYQSMYSAQGYLTHTLPVKTTTILNAKIAASLVQMVLTAAVVLALVVIGGICIDGTGIRELLHVLDMSMQDIYEQTGIRGAVFVGYGIVMLLLGCLNALLLFFAGSSIGQLFHKSKGAWGIAAGIGLYYITQIITMIVLVIAAAYLTEMFQNELSDLTILGYVMPGMVVLFVFWAVVYYMISRVIVQKHLNLE